MEEDIILTFKAPPMLKHLISVYLKKMDMYVSRSAFIRDAIREKIIREAPEMYRKIFTEYFGKKGCDQE